MSVNQDEQCEWCEKQEKLLIKWSIVIASITGVGGFAVLNPSGSEDISTDTKNNIMIIQYFFAFLNVLGGILTSISKFSRSLSLSEAHSAQCVQWSKFYRSIDMELSLDIKHRDNVVEFIMKCREEYDKLLDDSPDIPSITIQAFLAQFPDKENKPDVCNGLSIVVNEDAASVTGSGRAVSRWIGALQNIRRRSRDEQLPRVDPV